MNWAFKLYDVDNDGMIDINEIAVIMETLDSIEGVKPGTLKISSAFWAESVNYVTNPDVADKYLGFEG